MSRIIAPNTRSSIQTDFNRRSSMPRSTLGPIDILRGRATRFSRDGNGTPEKRQRTGGGKVSRTLEIQ